MAILVILAHPDPESFNHAVAQRAVKTLEAKGFEVVFHDLYGEGFDPLLLKAEIPDDGEVPAHVQKHCDELAEAEGIIIVHPNWWGQPPAILKGWIDRVVRPGVAYRFLEGDSGEGVPEGLLKAKVAVVFNTSNTPDGRERNFFGDPLQTLWKNCIFGLCGVDIFHRRTFCVVVTSKPEQRAAWLDDVEKAVSTYFAGGPAGGDR